jgi:hypothetical protein
MKFNKRRDLLSFIANEELAEITVDADEGNGELKIEIPHNLKDIIKCKLFNEL